MARRNAQSSASVSHIGAHTGGPSVALAVFCGFAEDGTPLVREGADGVARPARTVVALDASHVGREVTLQFIDGDRAQPVIAGLLSPAPGSAVNQRAVRIALDGQTLRIVAEQEIVLECGKSSVSLRRDGKLVIRGEHILSRASGVHRIRGGTIQLN